jgi:uncharacterized membrane protein YheB (UPF0754 family)
VLEHTLYNVDFWKHLSIPFVAAFVGWITNWVAIELTFRPLEFVGIRPLLGWQGIIPSKAAKMAEIFVDKTMFRLGTLQELFQQMEPGIIAAHISKVMDQRLESYTEEIMFYSNPRVWRFLPQAVKNRIYVRVRQEMPRLVDNLMQDAARNVEELIDFKHMLVQRLVGDKRLLNRLFLEAGAVEFKFIIRSGLHFGFLFGLIQLAVWTFHKSWWVLPTFGVLVGYATNWFAINIIFRPLEPHKIGPWTLQGLFLKRQKEVARVWCRLVTTEILTVQSIIYAMLYGPKSERAKSLIRGHIQPIVDEVVANYEPLAQLAVSEASLDEIRESVGEKAVSVSTDPFDHWPFNEDRATVIERLLRERMERLRPKDFQDLLRPCFQEDEMKLILTGAVLGLIAGVAQLLFVFGGTGWRI